MDNNLPSKEVQDALKNLFDHFEREDKPTRERLLRIYRQLKFYWQGFLRIWYDEVAHDWRVWDQIQEDVDDQNEYYDKPINVFRAYLESIIAALSVTTPKPICFPDDAENALDITTARAGDKIGQLIHNHNDGDLKWIHGLYVMCTEGMVAAYHYPKESKEYGTYEEDEFETVNENAYVCPNCGNKTPDYKSLCPECDTVIPSYQQPEEVSYERKIGTKSTNKVRQCLEVYGGTYVKTPLYACKQEDMPYLQFFYETHYSEVMARYEHLRGSRKEMLDLKSTGLYDEYEAYARLSPQYFGDFPTNTITMRNGWFRPCSYYVLEQTQCKLLEEKYPEGVKVVFANTMFAEAYPECLDDRWTLTHNPLSDYLQFDPLGMLLTSVQDITNDLISLIQQTVEHGIPESFADPTVLDFDAYRQKEVTPGGISPAKPQPGRDLAQGFHTIKTTTLGTEVLPWAERVQGLGQLASGALPSLFGGSSRAGSETAAEYSMSRAQALQRLQTPWKMLCRWWREIYSKMIPAYINDMLDDERMVVKNKDGGFINIMIRTSELEGKIGKYELDVDDKLPMSWSQQRDVVMQILNAGNPELMAAMLSPDNLQMVRESLGLTDMVIPGEDDRNKQFEEIRQLINSAPIKIPPSPELVQMAQMGQQVPPEMMQEQEFPSVDIEPDVDDHNIHAQICRRWLVSDAGRLCKVENPEGYKNVLLHLRQHMQEIQMSMPPPQETGQQQPNPSGKNQGALKQNNPNNATGDQDARSANFGSIQ